jgi:transketolase
LVVLGEKNRDVVVLDADLARSTNTFQFGDRFPERYFDMGVAEANMMGMAAGLAASGKIPFASTFCVFASLRAGEQVRNSIAYPRLNVKIVATNAGIEIGADGVTHQAIEDIAIMRAIPNMTVIVPSDPTMTAQVVHLVAEYEGPVYVRLGRQAAPCLYDDDDLALSLGGSLTVSEGEDVTLAATGNMVCRALEAAELLAEEGVAARVLDVYSIKPLDRATLVRAAQETGCVVTVEDHNVLGGLGSAIAEVLSEEYPVPIIRVGLQDTFAQSGDTEDLLEFYGMTAPHIVTAARKAMQRRDDLAG